MGSDNRDWHREWWAKKTGYVERAAFRLPENRVQPRGFWHWSLMLVVWLVISALLFALVRYFR
jgi:hypothetical protein